MIMVDCIPDKQQTLPVLKDGIYLRKKNLSLVKNLEGDGVEIDPDIIKGDIRRFFYLIADGELVTVDIMVLIIVVRIGLILKADLEIVGV